jgi:hypothetical protein
VREGEHYGRGFPLNRKSEHWTTYEFNDRIDPHDSHKHTGVAEKNGIPVGIEEEPYERIRDVITTFINQ